MVAPGALQAQAQAVAVHAQGTRAAVGQRYGAVLDDRFEQVAVVLLQVA